MESTSWSEIFDYISRILNVVLFEVKGTEITLSNVFVFILFIALSVVAAYLVRKLLLRRVLERFNIEKGMSYTLSRMTQYFIICIGALVSLQFIGLDLSSLAVIFGLLSVGIGFGLQNVTSNFISGLIILFERPIAVGDRVSVNNIEGDITQINIRSTKVRTINNVSIIVPNSEFVSKDVINYSYGDTTYRLDIEVGVSYGSDLDKVLKAMKEVADENESVLDDPEAEVHLVAFGESSWNMELRAWIGDVKYYPRIRNELNQGVVRKFREYDIQIPFPQRDLHLRSTVEGAGDEAAKKGAAESADKSTSADKGRSTGSGEASDDVPAEQESDESREKKKEHGEGQELDPRDRDKREEVKRKEKELLKKESSRQKEKGSSGSKDKRKEKDQEEESAKERRDSRTTPDEGEGEPPDGE